MNQTDFVTPRSRLNRRKVKGKEYVALNVQVERSTKDWLDSCAKSSKVGIGRLLDEHFRKLQ